MSNKDNVRLLLFVGISYLTGWGLHTASAQQEKKTFTVLDDIQLAVFGGSTGVNEGLLFSPDGTYFVVETERGRLDLNGQEDSLRFYRYQDVEDFLKRSKGSTSPSPIWVVNRSDKTGNSISKWRWLADSRGMAFLQRTPSDNYRLVLADLKRKTIEPLTSATEAVLDFDVLDRQHFIYTIADPVPLQKWRDERQRAAIVGTGHYLAELLLPEDPLTLETSFPPSQLWALIGNKRFQVRQGGMPVIPSQDQGLRLSPDGRSAVAALQLREVPPSWETLYPPPSASDAYRIRAGRDRGHEWVRIDLQRGSIQSLTDAPISYDAGLWANVYSAPLWSSDSQAILLPGTFLKGSTTSRPCIAVVDLESQTRTCVEMLKGRTETGAEGGFHHIQEASFVDGDKQRVAVRFRRHEDFFSFATNEYRRMGDDTWQVIREGNGVPEVGHDGLEVSVTQGLNEPPLVVAAYQKTSHVIWDPNPQLKNVELGQANVYKWKDKEGREWRGGLFKPDNYQVGRNYPLIIQTHGFTESKFIPSGIYPTALAARALAAAGIIVLQVSESICPQVALGEAQCAVSGYEAAANQLASEGVVDPDKIGIIGFSRTCWYVMEMLTTSSLHIRAASITDGMMGSYFQYLMWERREGVQETDTWHFEFDAMIGAQPFGKGLPQWMKRSPAFNLDKIVTPLLVVGEGPVSVLSMWESYAALHHMRKPVDLIMLNTHEHVLTNPAVRMASQGGSVDWFRFWLQGYEDSDPTKADQYARWRGLRQLQEENDKGK